MISPRLLLGDIKRMLSVGMYWHAIRWFTVSVISWLILGFPCILFIPLIILAVIGEKLSEFIDRVTPFRPLRDYNKMLENQREAYATEYKKRKAHHDTDQ